MERQPARFTIHEQGGFLGIDRTISVAGDTVTVFESGAIRAPRRLSDDEQIRIWGLASRAADAEHQIHHTEQYLPSDAKITDIVIEDGADIHRLNVTSGDMAPEEVWEFVSAVNAAALEAPVDMGVAR